eukprot:384920-Hanusia_phi.AAC.2
MMCKTFLTRLRDREVEKDCPRGKQPIKALIASLVDRCLRTLIIGSEGNWDEGSGERSFKPSLDLHSCSLVLLIASWSTSLPIVLLHAVLLPMFHRFPCLFSFLTLGTAHFSTTISHFPCRSPICHSSLRHSAVVKQFRFVH